MANAGIKNKHSKSRSRSRSRSISISKSKSRSKQRSKSKSKSRSKSRSIKGGGRAPAYVGSIQGGFSNRNGQQLFENPVGGIA